MRKLVLSIAVLILSTAAFADENRVYSLDINYLLRKDGSAVVTEVWDIYAAEGTEWYLPRTNMRDICLLYFTVGDENKEQYLWEYSWDVDRSLEEKSGKCGVVDIDDGFELCWGLGSYGRHCYTASYTLTNVVQSMDDYDMFHFQTVNRKMSTSPEKVRTVIEAEDCQLDTTNTGIWGFGYEGMSQIIDGKAVFTSAGPFDYENSMICLLRFDKGMFNSQSILEKPFQEHLDIALENSGYVDDEPSLLAVLACVFGAFALLVFGIVAVVRASRRMVLGMNYDEVEESKEIPFGGNLYIAHQVLNELMEIRKGSSAAAALIIRMVYNDILRVRKLDDENIEISFNPDFDGGGLDETAKVLYDMMKDASGEDGVLQENEFKKWSSKHTERVVEWEKAIDKASKKYIEEKGYKLDGRYSADFQREACKLLGLKKYLGRYAELKQADLEDVGRLKEYLVYAALFEVSDGLVERINVVNPSAFDNMGTYNYWMWHRLACHNACLSRAITNTVALSGASGTGGSSSFGGGAGFSGGGVGGGAR